LLQVVNDSGVEFDLGPAGLRLSAAMAVGETEARLNAARYRSSLSAQGLQAEMMRQLELAKDEAEINKVLATAKAEAEKQKEANTAMITEVLEDANARAASLPALADRIPEAEAYGAKILSEANAILADASAGADLMSVQSYAHVALDKVVADVKAAGESCRQRGERSCVDTALRIAGGAAEAVLDLTQ